MALITWSDEYLLNIEEIDLQHKKLLLIAQELYEVTQGSLENYKLSMSKIIKKLTDYTVYHFNHEEQFMRNYGYELADFHKSQHDNFVREITSQIEKLDDASTSDGQKFYDYLVKWILNHIARSDKTWANAIRSKL